MTFGERAIRYYRTLDSNWSVPDGIEILRAYDSEQVLRLVTRFFRRYFDDSSPRVGVFGINPGRFGAGRTGVAFTDPIRLQEELGIENDLSKKPELSSIFLYEVIDAFGGPGRFFGSFFITAVSPLGFLKNGKNFNYYDDPELLRAVEPHIVENLREQIAFGLTRRVAVCLGKGKNLDHFQRINSEHRLFDRIEALGHPRWIMQYRRPHKRHFLNQYLECLKEAAEELENI